MAKKPNLNETQLDMFKDVTPSEEVFIQPVVQSSIKEDTIQPTPVVITQPVVEPVSTPLVADIAKLVASKASVNDTIPEIAGQIKTNVNDFINDIPYESRFVSMSLVGENILITPIPEDNQNASITLKDMKDMYPNFVTQIQKVSSEALIDSVDNMTFIEKLRNMVDSKKLNMALAQKGKDIDKDVTNQVNLISKLESGDYVMNDDEDEISNSSPIEEPKVTKKNRLKM